jgi:OOP family OmpA-OmpF porin
VPDSADQCPHTTPGVKVDEKGCQIIEERLVLEGINFKTGSAVILPQSYKILDNAVEILKANPKMKVEIQGYTDSRGKAASNVRLSNARAKAVFTYLVKKGIPAAQMKYKGYGPANPIAPNTTDEGRAKNRRIEFKVL